MKQRKLWALGIVLGLFAAAPFVFRQPQTSHLFIAHALGELDGMDYTNAREALERNYDRGFRLFEMDLDRTSDGALVGVHLDSEKKIGLPKRIEEMTLAEFQQAKILKKYHPVTFKEVALWLRDHPDAIIVTDLKRNFAAVMDQVSKEIDEVDPQLHERVIPQFYNKEEADLMMQSKFSQFIYTLYRSPMKNDQVLTFLDTHPIAPKIYGITMPSYRLNNSFGGAIRSRKFQVFTHTVNNPKTAKSHFEKGATGVYTDNLLESDL